MPSNTADPYVVLQMVYRNDDIFDTNYVRQMIQQLKRALLVTVFITVMVFSLGAQQHQFSGWVSSFNTVKLNNKFSLHFDAQLRSNDEWVHTQTLLLRPGINYRISKTVTVTAGYAFINNRAVKSNTSGYFTEHRLWQQLLLLQNVRKISLQHRFRFEERFIPQTAVVNNQLKKNTTAFATRFRYFTRAIIPFKNNNPFTKGWFIALQNEVFVNTSNANATNNNFFDQNRVYFALGNRITKSFDAEIGFMNQYINGRTVNTANNLIQFASYLRL